MVSFKITAFDVVIRLPVDGRKSLYRRRSILVSGSIGGENHDISIFLSRFSLHIDQNILMPEPEEIVNELVFLAIHRISLLRAFLDYRDSERDERAVRIVNIAYRQVLFVEKHQRIIA